MGLQSPCFLDSIFLICNGVGGVIGNIGRLYNYLLIFKAVKSAWMCIRTSYLLLSIMYRYPIQFPMGLAAIVYG